MVWLRMKKWDKIWKSGYFNSKDEFGTIVYSEIKRISGCLCGWGSTDSWKTRVSADFDFEGSLEVASNMLRVTIGFLDSPPLPQYCYACFAGVTMSCYGGLDSHHPVLLRQHLNHIVFMVPHAPRTPWHMPQVQVTTYTHTTRAWHIS